MPRWLAWTFGALFVLALWMHAQQPLLGAVAHGGGFSESDLRALLAVSPCLDGGSLRVQPAPYFAAIESGLRPVGALSLALSTVLWTDGGALGGASCLPMILENLLLLLLAAVGAGLFLRRLALPWIGDEHARAAAWVTAVLCMLHPLSFAPLVSLASRGDLLVLVLGTWSGAEFLRGRQLRESRPALRAGAAVLVAGFAGGLAWAIPFVFAGSEFLSGRRFRSWFARIRTSLATLVVYSAVVAIEPLLRLALGASAVAPAAVRTATENLAIAVEKLGVLALPVNPESLSFAAYLLAAVLIVVALEPAFSAARSAPRLWSLILAIGALALLAASFSSSGVRVSPGNFTHAEVLMPGLFVVCAGLALASTALGGLRRLLMPSILAVGWAAMANSHAGAWATSVEKFAVARSDVARALELVPRPQAVCLLDIPEFCAGFAPLDRSVSQGFLAAAELQAQDALSLRRAREEQAPTVWISAPARSAWVQFTRTQRFAQLRATGFAVVLEERPGAGRVVVALPAAAPSSGSRRGFRDGSSAALDWDALSVRAVNAVGPRDTDLSRAPFLGFNAQGVDGHFTGGELQGVWVDFAGEQRAYFDAGASVDWLCSNRVRLAWPVEGWSNLRDADAQDELPKFEPEPIPLESRGDWSIAALHSPIVTAAQATLARRGSSGNWGVTLCDLETLEQARFDLAEPVPPSTTWTASGMGRMSALWSARGHALAWCIEYRAGGVALVRGEGLVKPATRAAR